ncbi:MAG: cation:dicarboxylase symporter family transporter [Vicinamibacterales bacterium]
MAHMPAAAEPPASPSRWPGLTTQVLIALILGVALGFLAPDVAKQLRPLADLFLRMIKMLIAPLLISTLVVGIAGIGDTKTMGRIGLKAMIYFWTATTFALCLGLALANLVKPGAGLQIAASGATAVKAAADTHRTFGEFLVSLVPTSIFDAMARGEILQVVVFSGFFGIALASIGERGRPVYDFMDSLAQLMFKFTGYVMVFAPLGVFGSIASTVAGNEGLKVLLTLGKLVLTLYAGLVVFVLVVLVGVSFLVRVPFTSFFRAIREPFLIAFSTASSEAALPKALEIMERFGVPKNIVSFVLPTGYSFNLDGTTLYLSLASMFVAQLAQVEFTLGQQVSMLLTLMVTSKGVAGVPRASLVVLTATLTQFGLPLEGAAMILGVDQFMDMARTAVNVMGNCIAAVVVARWEGVFDDAKMRAFESTAA